MLLQAPSFPSKKMSGIVFKAYCQLCFRETRMVHIGASGLLGKALKNKPKHPSQPQWHLTNKKLTPPSLEKERRVALQNSTPFNVLHPSSFFGYTLYDFVRKLQLMYYLPVAPSQIGFNSLILHSSILYLFQFSVTRTHGIKDFGGFFDKRTGHPAQKDWRFVFVRPSDTHVTMKCPVPATDALRGLALYSAEVVLS
jgi:hypothetical protein